MTLAEALTVGGLVISVIGGLVAVVWSLLLGKIEDLQKQNHQLKEQLAELDAKHDETHERVVKVEERTEANKEKIKEVDDRRHRYQVENTHSLQDLSKWITETLVEALKRP